MPEFADPGAEITNIAHKEDIQVVPLVGPSSILLALMASGMNGQSLLLMGICQSRNMNEKRNSKS